MAETHRVNTWNPLDYLSPKELARLDERLDYNLRDANCLVFWTGLSPELAQCWAAQHGLQTLVIAMGSLYSERGIGGARYGKSPKAWSKYMRGASGRFAEYARRGRRAIVVTKPPPNIYSTREWSNYRHLEEPILKGAFGGLVPVQIDYVHPAVKGAATFQYQIWPLDRSSEWYTFFSTLSPQGLIIRDVKDISVKGKVTIWIGQAEVPKTTKNAQSEQEKAWSKKEVNRKMAELERQMALAKKEARRKKTELERQMALAKKEARRKKTELEQQKARAKKEARRKKTELEQQKARAKKEARRKKAELERWEHGLANSSPC